MPGLQRGLIGVFVRVVGGAPTLQFFRCRVCDRRGTALLANEQQECVLNVH